MPVIRFTSLSDRKHRILRRILIVSLAVLATSFAVAGLTLFDGLTGAEGPIGPDLVSWLYRLSKTLFFSAGAVCLLCWRRFCIHDQVVRTKPPTWSGAMILPIWALLFFSFVWGTMILVPILTIVLMAIVTFWSNSA
jgi:hypothetical protein